MKRWLGVVSFLLGTACGASAQDAVLFAGQPAGNVAQSISNAPVARASVVAASSGTPSSPWVARRDSSLALAETPGTAEPATPQPRLVFGGRDDYRWQLGFGVEFLRFRSSIVNASMVGTNTSLTYNTNEWFAFEGDIATAFAPTIYVKEHVKYLGYGGGIRIGSRRAQWEPWAHAIVGGAHLQPQFADNSRNTLQVQAGGGADYRVHSRLSFRLEGDWVRTQFFNGSQNNFQLVGGIVLHF